MNHTANKNEMPDKCMPLYKVVKKLKLTLTELKTMPQSGKRNPLTIIHKTIK